MSSNSEKPDSKKKLPYACTECEFRSKSYSGLCYHKLSHTGEKPFSCSYCKFRAKSRSSVTNHELCHTGEKPYHCTYCKYKSKSYAGLAYHHKHNHSKKRPLYRNIFKSKAITKSALDQHKYHPSQPTSKTRGRKRLALGRNTNTKENVTPGKPEDVNSRQTRSNIASSQHIALPTKAKKIVTTTSPLLISLQAANSAIFKPISQTANSTISETISQTSQSPSSTQAHETNSYYKSEPTRTLRTRIQKKNPVRLQTDEAANKKISKPKKSKVTKASSSTCVKSPFLSQEDDAFQTSDPKSGPTRTCHRNLRKKSVRFQENKAAIKKTLSKHEISRSSTRSRSSSITFVSETSKLTPNSVTEDHQVKSPETVGVSSGGNSLPSNHKKVEEKSCFICDFKCTSSSILSEHILSHANFKPAPIYGVSHSTESQHQTYSPLDDTSVATEIVTEKTPPPTAKEPVFTCKFCPFEAKSFFSLSQHSQTHKKDLELSFSECQCCSAHNAGQGEHTVCNKENTTSPQETPQTLPDLCNTKEKPTSNTHPSKEILKEEAKPNAKSSKKGTHKYSCPYCNYSTVTKASLILHERVHTGNRPYQCSYCKTRFKQMHHLKRHVTSTHKSGLPVYTCSKCGFQTKSNAYFKKHMYYHKND